MIILSLFHLGYVSIGYTGLRKVIVIIYDITEKGKNWASELISKLFVPFLIIGVGSGAFGIGKIVHIEQTHQPVSIEYPATTTISVPIAQQKSENKIQLPTSPPNIIKPPVVQPNSPASVNSANQKMYVAAKTGKSYYFPWCATVKRIADKNKIWFSSKEEAQKAGFMPGNCKGMK